MLSSATYSSQLIFITKPEGEGGRSGTVGGSSPRCWVLPNRSVPKPDQHRRHIIQQESL